jgi:ferredoxin
MEIAISDWARRGLPSPHLADWQPREPLLLDECEACGICAARCPTERGMATFSS